MRHVKTLGLLACFWAAPLFAPSPAAAQSAAAEPTMEDVKALLKGDTIMGLMEKAAAKDPSYSGPTHLFPATRFMLRKHFMPHYFDTIDALHQSQANSVKFTVGNGDQTEAFEPLDITNSVMFLSKAVPDAPISEDLWGSLTARQLFEAFDMPKIKTAAIELSYPESRPGRLSTDISLTASYLSIQAKDDLGVWVYSLEVPLQAEPATLKFTTRGNIETFTVNGLNAQDITSIKLNNKEVYANKSAAKPSDALRKEMGL